jgi:hypothetical protein
VNEESGAVGQHRLPVDRQKVEVSRSNSRLTQGISDPCFADVFGVRNVDQLLFDDLHLVFNVGRWAEAADGLNYLIGNALGKRNSKINNHQTTQNNRTEQLA